MTFIPKQILLHLCIFSSSCSCFYVLFKTSSDPGKLKLQQIKLIKMNYFTDKFIKNNKTDFARDSGILTELTENNKSISS